MVKNIKVTITYSETETELETCSACKHEEEVDKIKYIATQEVELDYESFKRSEDLFSMLNADARKLLLKQLKHGGK